MNHVLLIQLPIPQLNFGMRTGNIPLAAACLKQAGGNSKKAKIDILPESVASYLGDAALLDYILTQSPDIIGFTIYNWNIERSLYLAKKIKETYHPKIILGGPEITQDNPLLYSEVVDFLIFGEGESIFPELLEKKSLWKEKNAFSSAEAVFEASPSPYLNHFLEPGINNLMYLETQRGCPYGCGFCYYNKSLSRMAFVNEDLVLKGVEWAVEHGSQELCLLDPSLNLRPDLKSLLKKISVINKGKSLAITGEIRADAIDGETADLFSNAGFSGFEIGLQTTNQRALKIMNRPTNLKKFVHGAKLLKEREILPRIDLIVGLPGDTLDEFKESVNFLADHDLFIDVQVFSLSVLPGTDFRKNSRNLGLEFETSPPYTVLKTQTFSEEDMLHAFDYAESVFDISLFPDPYLDISFRTDIRSYAKNCGDHTIFLKNREYVSKLILNSKRSIDDILNVSKKLTHPYQVFIGRENNDIKHIHKTLELLTLKNPFTPLELVFLEPAFSPDTNALLDSMHIKRPHYLDIDLYFLYGSKGNRTVLFTLVTEDRTPHFFGHMKRQIFWWKQLRLPGRKDFKALSDLDGILIDTNNSAKQIYAFQDHFFKHADDLPFISFADTVYQKRWLALTASDQFSSSILNLKK